MAKGSGRRCPRLSLSEVGRPIPPVEVDLASDDELQAKMLNACPLG